MMKINVKNEGKIAEALEASQGRCSARTIYAKDVVEWTKMVQDRLDRLMCKKDQVGVIAMIDPHAQDFPGAYRFTPESTGFRIKKCASGWFMVGCYRGTCGSSTKSVILRLTRDHEEAITKFVSQYKNW